MSLRSYLKCTWPQLLLVVTIATCLGLQAVQCMHIAPETAYNVPLVLAVSALAVIWLHLSTRNRRTIAIGLPLFAIVCIVAALAACGGNLASLFDDSYDNPLLVYPIVVGTAVLTFLLTRKQITTVVLAIGGCVFCGAVEFLYVQHLVWPTIVFMCASAAYLVCLRATKFAGDDFAASFQASKLASALGLVAVAAAVACGIFLLVIAPLDPPTHELKLITRYYALEEVHVSGDTELIHQHNEKLDSRNRSDDEEKTDQESAKTKKYQGTSQTQQSDNAGNQGGGGVLASNLGDPASLVRYFREHWWLLFLVPLALAAIWAGIVAVRRHLRRKRLERWRTLPPRERALAEYHYLRSVLERICKVSAAGLTPAEYAEAAKAETENLERTGESATFAELSSIATAAAYGSRMPGEEGLARIEAYLLLVPKRVLHRFGRWRYLRLFFKV